MSENKQSNGNASPNRTDATSEKINTPELVAFAGCMSGKGSVDGVTEVASFNHPLGVAVDHLGNIYVADTGQSDDSNNTIRKISPAGAVSTIAGLAGSRGSTNGIGAAARFSGPSGVAVDTLGNVYVADTNNHRIRKITSAGIVTTYAGSGEYGDDNGIATKATFSYPRSIALDSLHNLYVLTSHSIRKITPDGIVTTFAGSEQVVESIDGRGEKAGFGLLHKLAVDLNNNLYVTDMHAIRKISPAGDVITISGSLTEGGHKDGAASEARFEFPNGLTIDGAGNIYVADSDQTIRKISPAGMVSTLAGISGKSGHVDGGGQIAQFNSNYSSLASDAAGNVYLADSDNHSIRKITPAGQVTTVAGFSTRGKRPNVPADTCADNSSFRVDSYSRIAVDSNRNVLLGSSQTVYKISPTGVTTELNLGSSLVNFRNISSIATDAQNNIYIKDIRERAYVSSGGGGYSPIPKFLLRAMEPAVFNSIYKITPDGQVKKILGKSAKISAGAIAVDTNGNIFSEERGIITKTIQGRFSVEAIKIAGSEHAEGNIDGNGAQAKFGTVTGIALDKNGNIFVCDIVNNNIRKITPEGDVTTFAGSGNSEIVDGRGKEASFKNPTGLTIDAKGNLYLIELRDHIVRKITPSGEVSTFVGKPGRQGFLPGRLPGIIASPQALAIHGTSLYILMADGLIAEVRDLY